MIKLVRYSPAMFLIFVLSGIIAIIVAYVPNYEKSMYEKTSKNTTYAGYPAGDNIPRVNSVEDINKCEEFTVKIKCEDIKELGIYIENSSIDKFYVASEGYLYNEIDRMFNNSNNVSYSEYCMLTLESGEKIIAFIDVNLLDIKKNENIVLPIGEKKYFLNSNLISFIKKRSEINDENSNWYIDMSGIKWRQNELGSSVSKKRDNILVITFILSFIAITFILYKFAEVKLGDRLKD